MHDWISYKHEYLQTIFGRKAVHPRPYLGPAYAIGPTSACSCTNCKQLAVQIIGSFLHWQNASQQPDWSAASQTHSLLLHWLQICSAAQQLVDTTDMQAVLAENDNQSSRQLASSNPMLQVSWQYACLVEKAVCGYGHGCVAVTINQTMPRLQYS